ncbi:hypothetical protein GUITHDRAFT_113193 [Guillardia theta CCMP2712]|uniref:Ubiquitinyl hydrolase 1 n=1 Tax=Guillardia theta (strain CCMP2712) TaxID=905079 RepID=L1IWL3_GUITC|nr:hypothetical protein GUITHDRAFT_113193 [Guillardia theta CCMP2712]EKX40658.1 hypothetical protein GUITHDRAFT_113193 [Guillardia theta CCMP2712]|eukprot:XP_005827638.1 hypothetical protein GUITHDRAFT_113193 [Guillardia theta CCMP2712]
MAALSTKSLTNSFGWTSADTFEQQDVQEFFHVLLNTMEEDERQNTNLSSREGAWIKLHDLFQGEVVNFVRCEEIGYESKTSSSFVDISLNLNGNSNIFDALKQYHEVVHLTGDNRLKCEDGVLRDAEFFTVKGSFFSQLPQVLLLHLQRFVWDWETDTRIKGGHYFAYIRVKDGWFEFNDADIKEVSQQTVLSTCGCDAGVGAVKRLKAATAYMLVYGREDARDENDVKVPEMVRERIDLENSKLKEAKLAEEEKKNTVFCTVRGKVKGIDIDRKVQLSKKMSLRTTSTTIARDVLADTANIFDNMESLQETVRLRRWDEAALVPQLHIPWTFDESDDLANKALMEMMEGGANVEFFLEEKPANAEFPPISLPPRGLTIRVCKLQETTKQPSESVFLSIDKESSCLQLANDVEAFVGVPTASQEWLVVADDNVVQSFPSALADKTLRDINVVHGTTIYLGQTDSHLQGNQHKQMVEDMFFTTSVKVQWENGVGATEETIFALDVRWTVKQLKEQLSARIEKSQQSFHLLLPDGKALAEEEKKLKDCEISAGEALRVVDGTSSVCNHIRFEVFQMSLSDCSQAYKGLVDFPRSAQTSSLRDKVAHMLNIPTAQVCMRRDTGGSLSSILLDEHKLERLPASNRLIVHVQEEKLSEDKSTDVLFVYVRRLETDAGDHGSDGSKAWKGRLSPCCHVPIHKSWSIEQAAARLVQVFSLSCPPRDLAIIRVPWGTPMDALSVAKLAWRASEGQVLDMAAGVGENIREGSLLFIRDPKEWLPALSQQDTKERGVSIAKLNQQPPISPPPPPPPPP